MNYLKRKLKNFLSDYCNQVGGRSYEEVVSKDLINDLCQDYNLLHHIDMVLEDTPSSIYTMCKLDKDKKLSLKEKVFLVSTLENHYKLSYRSINRIITDKMSIISAAKDSEQAPLDMDELLALDKDSSKYPDFDKLFLVTNGNGIYDSLVEEYKLSILAICTNEEVRKKAIGKITDRIDTFNKLPKNILKNIRVENRSQMENIISFPNNCLDWILRYNCDEKSIASLLNYIIIHKSFSEKLNKLEFFESSFSDLLDFILEDDMVSVRASLAEKMLMNGMMFKGELAKKITKLPSFLIEYLDSYEDPINNSETKDFVRDINCTEEMEEYEEYHKILKKIPQESQTYVKSLVTNKTFSTLNLGRRNQVLQTIIEEDNFKKAEFLFNINKSYNGAFLDNISDDYVWNTLVFISKEKDEEVLNAKFRVLNRIKGQLEAKSLSTIKYPLYLGDLEASIINMDVKDKIKYLEAHSKFFENHDLEKFIKDLGVRRETSAYKDKIIRELRKNKKYKKLKYIFKFANFMADHDQYNINIASQVVNQLANAQTKENMKAIFNAVTSDIFIKKSPVEQQNILCELPGLLERIDHGNLTIIIPDHQAIESVLESDGDQNTESVNQKQLVFVNKDTGIKVNIGLSKNHN